MTYKPFIFLLGIFLGSHGPAVAQTPPPLIVLAQEQVAPIIPILPTVSTALPALSFRLFHDAQKSNFHFNPQVAGAYQGDYSLERLSPMNEVKTLIFTQSNLPLVQFWGGRLQLDAFQSTLHIQNGQLALVGAGMRGSLLSAQSYPGGPRSLRLSGLNLSFRFGRDAHTGHPAQLWRRLTHMVDAVLN
jgi:hypothetical protein